MKRRTFLHAMLFSSAALALPANLAAATSGKKNRTMQKRTYMEDAFHLGIADWTFHKFNIDTALATMKRLDLHYLCIKDFHLPLNSTDEEIASFHTKLEAAGVKGYAVGPIYMKTKEEVDRAFAYAKRVGVNLLVGVPNYELLPYVEKKVQEYDIRLAIHLHGPDMKLFPDATDIWNHVKDMDKRIGMCFDIGHNLRYGSDSLADYARYHERIFDIHLKDVTGNTKQSTSIEIGRGVINFPAFIKLLRKYHYAGSLSLEYEKDMDDPFIGIAESIGYMKAVLKES